MTTTTTKKNNNNDNIVIFTFAIVTMLKMFNNLEFKNKKKMSERYDFRFFSKAEIVKKKSKYDR